LKKRAFLFLTSICINNQKKDNYKRFLHEKLAGVKYPPKI